MGANSWIARRSSSRARRLHARAVRPPDNGERRGGGVMAGRAPTATRRSSRGHNGLVTAAYLAKAGRTVLVLERRERGTGGSSTRRAVRAGVRAPGIVHTVGRLRQSVDATSDLGLQQAARDGGARRSACSRRQPDGRRLTLRAGRGSARPSELRERSRGTTPRPTPAFDAGFVARPSSCRTARHHAARREPTRRSRDAPQRREAGERVPPGLGQKPGRGDARCPMAIADYVARRSRPTRCGAALASRGRPTAPLAPRPVVGRVGGGAARSDAAGNDGGARAARVSTIARRWRPGAPAGGAGERRPAPSGAEIRTAVPRSSRSGSSHRRDRQVTSIRAGLSGEEIGGAPGTVISRLAPEKRDCRRSTGCCDPGRRSGRRTCAGGPANNRTPGVGLEGRRGHAVARWFTAAVRRRRDLRCRLAGRIVDRARQHRRDLERRAFDASWKYGGIGDEPYLMGDDPDAFGPGTLAPGGDARDAAVTQWTRLSCAETDWSAERDRLGDLVVKASRSTRRGSRTGDRAAVTTLVDLETEYGLSGAHHAHHGEPGLISSSSGGRQLGARAVPGWRSRAAPSVLGHS